MSGAHHEVVLEEARSIWRDGRDPLAIHLTNVLVERAVELAIEGGCLLGLTRGRQVACLRRVLDLGLGVGVGLGLGLG